MFIIFLIIGRVRFFHNESDLFLFFFKPSVLR